MGIFLSTLFWGGQDPWELVGASASIKFSLDEKEHVVADLVAGIKFNVETGPEELMLFRKERVHQLGKEEKERQKETA